MSDIGDMELTTRGEILVRLTCAALTGLLADPTPRPHNKGESCTAAVARKAVEHAQATYEAFCLRYDPPRSH